MTKYGKKALLQVSVTGSSGHLIELNAATLLKVLHVVNPHLHAQLLSFALNELGDSTGDCHMIQYDHDFIKMYLSIEQQCRTTWKLV